ncbi:MAG: glycosyltransferase [Sphingobacteriales bacterium]|nr:MAG: glycosyltransferase [Sphingobacteriales bacterium]
MRFSKVSIQIPTYNQATQVVLAIESCLRQTYSNIEIIITDDNSGDDTATAIQKYLADGRVKYFRNDKNIGRVANYKKALYQYCSGDWVLNLDGDDYLTNDNFISQAMELIIKEGEETVLFYQGAHVYKTAMAEKIVRPRINGDTVIMPASDYVKDIFFIRHFSHMATVYNRQKAMTLGFYEKDIISADMDSFLNLAIKHPKGKVILSMAIAGVWLQHDTNTSKSLHFKTHLKNFRMYFSLAKKMRNTPHFSNLSVYGWLIKAMFFYWRTYISSLIKGTGS